jgi:hypothetical protein
MTLASFRSNPRQGHLDRAKRIYGYLYKMHHGAIRIRTDEPDYSDLPDKVYDWENSIYADAEELLPHDCPPALGKASCHDYIRGCQPIPGPRQWLICDRDPAPVQQDSG